MYHSENKSNLSGLGDDVYISGALVNGASHDLYKDSNGGTYYNNSNGGKSYVTNAYGSKYTGNDSDADAPAKWVDISTGSNTYSSMNESNGTITDYFNTMRGGNGARNGGDQGKNTCFQKNLCMSDLEDFKSQLHYLGKKTISGYYDQSIQCDFDKDYYGKYGELYTTYYGDTKEQVLTYISEGEYNKVVDFTKVFFYDPAVKSQQVDVYVHKSFIGKNLDPNNPNQYYPLYYVVPKELFYNANGIGSHTDYFVFQEAQTKDLNSPTIEASMNLETATQFSPKAQTKCAAPVAPPPDTTGGDVPTPPVDVPVDSTCPCNCYDEVVTENWYLADNCPDGNCFPIVIEETEEICDNPPEVPPTFKPDCETIRKALMAKGYTNLQGLDCSTIHALQGLAGLGEVDYSAAINSQESEIIPQTKTNDTTAKVFLGATMVGSIGLIWWSLSKQKTKSKIRK